jgi:hypothetical protein
MSIDDRELTIYYHWDTLKATHQIPEDKELPSNLLRLAEYTQVCSVIDALREIHMLAVSLSSSGLGEEATAQLGRGFGRRTKFIWISVREIFHEVPPARNKPLSIEVAEGAAKALNEIYINIRGSLDNLARCLLAIRGDHPRAKPLAPIQIELFNAKFLERIADPGFSASLEPFRKWNTELKDRRDPAAHRLPLFVLQAYQDDESSEKRVEAEKAYFDANNKVLAALSRGDHIDELIANADKLRDELLSIGKFHPLFTSDDKLGFMAIYPTVPEDIGKLIMIGRGVLSYISREMAQTN